MFLAVRTRVRSHSAELLMLPALGCACLIGALSPYIAYEGRPFAVLALVLAGMLLLVTLARPAIGVAAAVALYPLGVFGLVGRPGWVVPTAWTVLMFGLAVLSWQDRGWLESGGPLIVAILALLAAALLSLAFGGNLDEALPILRSTASAAMLCIAVVTFVTTRKAIAWMLGTVTVVALFVGGLAVWQYVSGSGARAGFFTGSGALVTRVSAGFGQPNQLAGFLVMLVPFLIAAVVLRAPARWLGVAALVLAVAGITLTFSRTALVALLVVPLFFLPLRWSLVAVPVVTILLAFSGPGVLKERFSTLSQDGSEIATRVDFWKAGLAIFDEHPLVGVGPGGYPDAYSNARLPGKQFLPQSLFEPPPHAHNLFINTGAEQGLVGLAALVAFIAAALLVARRARAGATAWAVTLGRAGLASTCAFLIHNTFDVTLLEATGTVFVALVGLVTAAGSLATAEPAGDG